MYTAVLLLNNLLFMLLIWICAFLVVFVHEMGHALMYRIFFRNNDWHITIGTGRTIIKLKKFTVRVFLSTGSFNFPSKYKGSKFQYIMMLLGGSLANVFFIILLIPLAKTNLANELTFAHYNLYWFLGFTFWVNVSQFVFAVVPMKLSFWPFKGYISDGMRILKMATKTSKN
ncbi:MAG: hypothetical protein ACLKAK_10390 [Alkaliphilus sp.]